MTKSKNFYLVCFSDFDYGNCCWDPGPIKIKSYIATKKPHQDFQSDIGRQNNIIKIWEISKDEYKMLKTRKVQVR